MGQVDAGGPRKHGTKPHHHGTKKNPAGAGKGSPHEVQHPHIGSGPKVLALAGEHGALNPPFDPRMRRVGSPLNNTQQIQRGWIQSEDGGRRVNFLFNPSELNVGSQVDTEHTQNPVQAAQNSNDAMDPFYTSTASSLSVDLLYDRTYELFSKPNKKSSLANKYGVHADVVAWYTFLNMISGMPSSWMDTIITQPMNMVPAYLFVGPRLYYYGFVSGLSVTYSHWSQNMIPQRGSVHVDFTILPRVKATGGSHTHSQGPTKGTGIGWIDSFIHGG